MKSQFVYIGAGVLSLLLFTGSRKVDPLSPEEFKNLPFKWDQVFKWYSLAVKYGDMYGVEPEMILAIISQESKGYPNALGDMGTAYGLMQVTTDAVTDVKLGSPSYNPERNIQQGTAYFARMRNYTNSDFEALRAYNAGLTGSKENRSAGFDYATRVFSFKNDIEWKITGQKVQDWIGGLFD